MSKELTQIPQARSWRDIPQPVKARAMSGSGRRRLLGHALRFATVGTMIVGIIWGTWKVASALRRDPRSMPALAKSVPVKEVVLITDGVLDRDWVTRVLALPKNASLMSLNLAVLRDQVLASGQVRTATLTLDFDHDTLVVTLSERSPVVRIKADVGGEVPRELLVARDGTVFEGVDFDPAMIQTLLWLDGVKLSRRGERFAPIVGMDAAAELLAKAKLEAEHLYRSWEVISLARLASDGEIEVRAREGTRIVFGTREDYFRQLARLDYILDKMAKEQPGRILGQVNLSIGSNVIGSQPQLAGMPAPESTVVDRERRIPVPLPLKPLGAQPISPVSSNSQTKIKLEL